ncbi:MAG TPA: hypothetical protein VN154_04520 [Rhizomicrobium sp.]|nr:hypothetical protein [Rhizomicrobium sp.]
MSTFSPITIDSSLLLNYYAAQLNSSATQVSQQANNSAANGNSNATQSSGTSFGQSTSSTSSQTPPWDVQSTLSQQAEEAKILSTTNFVQQSTTPLVGGSATSSKLQADNQKLFTLYQAVSQLSQLANIATQKSLPSGVLAGYNTQFQTGLQQVESFINATSFNNLTLQAQNPSASATSQVSIPFAPSSYQGGTIVSDANYGNPLPGVSTSDNFNIGVTKGGTTTNVAIDLSQIQGPLTLGNIVNYVNQQLAAAGFATRFQATITSGSASNIQQASYGITINPAPSETIALSSAQATPALYLAGTSGSTTGTPASNGQPPTSADNQGRLTKLSNLSSSPQSVFSETEAPSSGNTTALSTVVDAQGNVYVLGNATGNFGGQLNQGTQDVYLSKYDSAGNLQWTKLLGSAGTANAASLALDPSSGGVVVSGSTTAALGATAITNGNNDSFVASYDANGNQLWSQQIPTLNGNQANAVTVDAQGNVYIGGQVNGTIGAGQTSAGGTDAYLAQLNSSGQIVSEQQFGTSGNDQVSQVATTADGGLVVASVQNGEAILSKYAGGSVTSTPVWQMDLGSLQGGAITGIAISGNQIYVSGTTNNTSLNAGGQASIAVPSSGNTDAFVFGTTDNGTSATAGTVSYVGTPSGSSTGGAVTVGPDGTVYLAGTTAGTFAGQSRNVPSVDNAFVTALAPSGSINWTRQFGGADGQSTGAGVAVDPAGSSVLDALGLPTGTISVNQSVALSSNSTLQTGDSFQLQIEGTAGRTATITVQQGDTLQTLADQINSQLLSAGKATVTFANGGEALKITANPGNTLNLIAGPADTDALGRLGITPGVITAPAKTNSKTSTTSGATANGTSFGKLLNSASNATAANGAEPVYGLGLNTSIDLLSSGDASVAKISLQNVLTQITSIYQKINPSTAPSTTASSQPTGTVPAALRAQIANYSLALATFSMTNSLSAASSSSSPLTA